MAGSKKQLDLRASNSPAAIYFFPSFNSCRRVVQPLRTGTVRAPGKLTQYFVTLWLDKFSSSRKV
jgi:hypothetical protein